MRHSRFNHAAGLYNRNVYIDTVLYVYTYTIENCTFDRYIGQNCTFGIHVTLHWQICVRTVHLTDILQNCAFDRQGNESQADWLHVKKFKRDHSLFEVVPNTFDFSNSSLECFFFPLFFIFSIFVSLFTSLFLFVSFCPVKSITRLPRSLYCINGDQLMLITMQLGYHCLYDMTILRENPRYPWKSMLLQCRTWTTDLKM